MEEFIKITGARENNLKNINLTIPRNKLVVFTGVSGSGKSTLAFDTIFAEGQRRYMESLSSYARQFLGQSSKPEVDRIEGLSPSIAIDQKTTNHNPRSTVGTVTEIYDYMRLLFAKIGVAYCLKCHKPIKRQSVDQIIDRIAEYPQGSKLLILAPIARGQKGTFANKFEELKKDGFVRVEVDGKVYTLDEEITLEKNIKHDIYVVVDRVVVKEDIKSRLSDSVELAIKTGDGIVVVESEGQKEVFSTLYACDECGYSIEEITPRMFSFNSPYGACEHCTGLGFTEEIDPKLIIKDPNKSLNQGAVNVSGWNFTNSYMTNIYFKAISKQYGINLNMPLKDMPKDKLDIVLYGNHGEKLNYHYSSLKHSGDMTFSYEGVIPNLERRFRETTSEWIKQEIAKYMRQTTCSVCGGKRLKPSVLNIKINELNISEMSDMSVDKLIGYFGNLKLGKTETEIAKPIIKEIVARLKFLQNVGLGYLTLSRSAESLSGGESQRIRLATQIGSGLTGVLYILDEPSIGLHQSDNTKLLGTLKALRDVGNTVIVVEHDEDTIRAADFVVDIGKFAGVHGGEVVVAGTPQDVMNCKESITGAFLSGRDKILIPEATRKGNGGEIKIRGAYLHNLKNVDVSFPLAELTVVTGVSGSGKSSLVNGVLCPGVRNTLQKEQFDLPAKSVEIVGEVDKIIDIDQSPIGRTPRSNPATYVGVFTPIRELFASTIDAKERGYSAGRFSFNVKGGRCENCEGDGVKEIEMYFLPDIEVPCEVCKGKRYNRETLEVKYKGKSIFDVLDMTIEEALKFFEAIPQIKNKLQALFDVGLGYIKLGQSSTTLSGGEAQRVKLATELSKRSTGKTLYILDEPTTGLSTYDVKKLIQILQTLVDRGNTVVVIEHNLDVIKVADNIIDLGPHGGDQGGEIVANGTPKEVAKRGVGLTAEFLKQYFDVKPNFGG